MEQPGAGGSAKRASAIGEQNERECGRKGKAGPGRQRACKTGPLEPYRKANLAARRTGQELT